MCVWRWSPFGPALMVMGSLFLISPCRLWWPAWAHHFLSWLLVVISLPGSLAGWHRRCCPTPTILVVRVRTDCRIAEGLCKTKWVGDKIRHSLKNQVKQVRKDHSSLTHKMMRSDLIWEWDLGIVTDNWVWRLAQWSVDVKKKKKKGKLNIRNH